MTVIVILDKVTPQDIKTSKVAIGGEWYADAEIDKYPSKVGQR